MGIVNTFKWKLLLCNYSGFSIFDDTKCYPRPEFWTKNTYNRTKRLNRFSSSSDNRSHIYRVHFERKEYPKIIVLFIYFDRFNVRKERRDNKVEKFFWRHK